MSEVTLVTARSRLGQALAFVRAAEPRRAIPRRSVVVDIAFAALILAASLVVSALSGPGATRQLLVDQIGGQVVLSARPGPALGLAGWPALAAAVVTAAPLAARRRYPLAALLALVLGMLATRRYTTDVTFLALVFAAYSAVAHSRFRGAALLSVPLVGVVVAAAFWSAHAGPTEVGSVPLLWDGRVSPFPPVLVASSDPWRFTALVVLVALISITVVANAMHAADAQARVRRLQAEHEAATRRAVELERARIASELHDVVTHNVSVMIVQAGAARQVLPGAPEEARTALLAVESSGRAAMAELRHLLGLLSPVGAAGDDGGPEADEVAAGQDLRPQPGLGQLRSLIDRVSAAGLPVELDVRGLPRELPAGLDLAAFRIVQEALTNVIKHAGKPRTSVTIACREGDLVVEVADAGRAVPAAGPLVAGGGRGLLGLRERAALYGGELDAGPRPGGGWLVRARIPVGPPCASAQSPELVAPATSESLAAGSA